MLPVKTLRIAGWILGAGAVGVSLYVLGRHNYLLYHAITELFSIAVALAAFLISWNCRKFTRENYLSFVGISFLCVSSLDLLHMLAYNGMGVFKGYGINLPTQLWIGARSLQSIAFVLAALLIDRKPRHKGWLGAFLAATGLVLLSIFYWDIFPVCFVDGEGLTPFKRISELVIAGLFAVSIGLLVLRRSYFSRPVFLFLLISLGIFIASELSFILYTSPYGAANMTGHFLKIVAFFLVYKALVESQLIDPYSTLFRELQERERAQRDEWKRLEAILNAIPDGIYIVNSRHEVEYVNPAMERMFGLVRGRPCYEFVGSRLSPCPDCGFSEVMADHIVQRSYRSAINGCCYDTLDAPFINLKTGEKCKLKIIRDVTEFQQTQQQLQEAKNRLEERVRERTEQLYKTVGTLQEEVAERIRTEKELVENQKRLRNLSMELVYAEERERREVATQLHDSIGPLLAFSKRELGMLCPKVRDELKEPMQYVSEMIRNALEQTRTLTFDLSSTTLYVLGFEAAVEELAEQFAEKEQFICEVADGEDLGILDEQTQILLYRSVRELFINIAKHSKAGRVTVKMRRLNGSVEISVQDDGVGFDPQKIHTPQGRPKGFGLFSLQERLVNIGGSMKIESACGRGTKVTLTVPVGPIPQ